MSNRIFPDWDPEADGNLNSKLMPSFPLFASGNSNAGLAAITTTGKPSFPRPEMSSPFADSAFNDESLVDEWDDKAIGYNPDYVPNAAVPDPSWRYMIHTGNDGMALVDQYLKDNLDTQKGSKFDNEPDINIYYEQSDAYNLLGTVCFVKMNQVMAQRVSGVSRNASPEWLAGQIIADADAYRKQERWYARMDKAKLTSAIKYELALQKNPDRTPVGVIAQALSKVAHELAEYTRSKKYTAKNWDPAVKGYDLVIKESREIKAIQANWLKFRTDADATLSKVFQLTEYYKEDLPGFIVDFLKFLVDFLRGCIDAVDEIVNAVSEVNHIIRLVNAFLCGGLNEIRDMIAGFLDIVSLLLSLKDSADVAKIKEGIENAIEQFRKEPDPVKKWLHKAFEELKARYTADTGEYQVAYNLGEDIFNAALWFVTILDAVKLVKSLTAFKSLEEWVGKMGKRIEDAKAAAKRVTTNALESGGTFQSRLARLLENTYDDVAKAIKEVEMLIKSEQQEFAYIYKNGKLSTRITSGLNNRIIFTLEQLKSMAGAVVTHNHPLGSSLSAADIRMFLESNLKELRAVCEDGRVFSLKNNGIEMSIPERERMIEDAKEFIKTEYAAKGVKDPVVLARLEAEELIKRMQARLGRQIDYINFKP